MERQKILKLISVTDVEFEIIDELYFVKTFGKLKDSLKMQEQELKDHLISLIEKGWIKILDKETEEEIDSRDDFQNNYMNYNFLVSKAGLMAHNSR
ncbi:MAG: transporter [Cytophagaceae bacterium]